MFSSAGNRVEPGGVDAAVAQDIRQFCNIPVLIIVAPCEEVPQIVGKHFTGADASLGTESLHLRPDIAPVHGPPAFRDKDWAAGKSALPDILAQLAAEFSGQENCADVSFLYYRGYQAVDQASGERLNVTGSGENKVRVMIPAGYEGTFRVRFVSPWYWRACEAVSAAALVGIAAAYCIKRKGRHANGRWVPGRKMR